MSCETFTSTRSSSICLLWTSSRMSRDLRHLRHWGSVISMYTWQKGHSHTVVVSSLTTGGASYSTTGGTNDGGSISGRSISIGSLGKSLLGSGDYRSSSTFLGCSIEGAINSFCDSTAGTIYSGFSCAFGSSVEAFDSGCSFAQGSSRSS